LLSSPGSLLGSWAFEANLVIKTGDISITYYNISYYSKS
jgi:hypothetical protein